MKHEGPPTGSSISVDLLRRRTSFFRAQTSSSVADAKAALNGLAARSREGLLARWPKMRLFASLVSLLDRAPARLRGDILVAILRKSDD
jgi:hypothetical protein